MTRTDSRYSNYFKYSPAIAVVGIIISDSRFYLTELLNGIKKKEVKKMHVTD
jgi:hypothetical protein